MTTRSLDVWLDGVVCDATRASIAVTDPGFLWADGVFETLRVVHGVPIALPAHLARLTASLASLALPCPPWDLARGVHELLATLAPSPAELALRITVTARPTVLMQLRPVDASLLARRAGLHLWTLPELRAPSLLATHKTLAYLPHRLARRLHSAGSDPAFEGLWLGPGDVVLEGTSSNLFAVFPAPGGWTLLTPPLSASILPGVTRARLLALARQDPELSVREASFTRHTLTHASELFATSALLPCAGVTLLDGEPLAGAQGPVTRRLAQALAEAERGDASA